MKSSMLSVWEGLWHAHDRTKRLLLSLYQPQRIKCQISHRKDQALPTKNLERTNVPS